MATKRIVLNGTDYDVSPATLTPGLVQDVYTPQAGLDDDENVLSQVQEVFNDAVVHVVPDESPSTVTVTTTNEDARTILAILTKATSAFSMPTSVIGNISTLIADAQEEEVGFDRQILSEISSFIIDVSKRELTAGIQKIAAILEIMPTACPDARVPINQTDIDQLVTANETPTLEMIEKVAIKAPESLGLVGTDSATTGSIGIGSLSPQSTGSDDPAHIQTKHDMLDGIKGTLNPNLTVIPSDGTPTETEVALSGLGTGTTLPADKPLLAPVATSDVLFMMSEANERTTKWFDPYLDLLQEKGVRVTYRMLLKLYGQYRKTLRRTVQRNLPPTYLQALIDLHIVDLAFIPTGGEWGRKIAHLELEVYDLAEDGVSYYVVHSQVAPAVVGALADIAASLLGAVGLPDLTKIMKRFVSPVPALMETRGFSLSSPEYEIIEAKVIELEEAVSLGGFTYDELACSLPMTLDAYETLTNLTTINSADLSQDVSDARKTMRAKRLMRSVFKAGDARRIVDAILNLV